MTTIKLDKPDQLGRRSFNFLWLKLFKIHINFISKHHHKMLHLSIFKAVVLILPAIVSANDQFGF